MKVTRKKLNKMVEDIILLQEQEEKKKKKIQMPKFLGKALTVLNPNKNKKIKDVNIEDEKEVEKVVGDNETIDNLKYNTDKQKQDVLALEQFALNLLKDKNYNLVLSRLKSFQSFSDSHSVADNMVKKWMLNYRLHILSPTNTE